MGEQCDAAGFRPVVPVSLRLSFDGVIAIDPGGARKGCASVLAVDGILRAHAIEIFSRDTPRALALDVASVGTVVIERPQQDGRTRGVRPEDLINFTWEGALLAAAYAHEASAALVELTPTEWKGTEPKAQQHARLWDVLSVAERTMLGGRTTEAAIMKAREKGALKRWEPHRDAYYPRAFVMVDVLDAAALLCVYVGRLAKRG